MAASANPSPSGNQQQQQHQDGGNNNSNNNNSQAFNGNENSGGAVMENSGRINGLKHCPRVSVDWSNEEQAILEDGLVKYASEPTMIRYAKIALQLHDKSVRDVALRCRWVNRKEIGKRRKEDHNLSKKNKDKKERVIDPSTKSSSHVAARPNIPSYALPMLPMDNDDGISFEAIGGGTGQLLEQNAQLFNQISANFATYQIQENTNLFCRARDNILSILNDLNDMPGIMKQMPPLPVKVNEELANNILPRTNLPRKKP